MKKSKFLTKFLAPLLIGYIGGGYLILSAVNYLNNERKVLSSENCIKISRTNWALGTAELLHCDYSDKYKEDKVIQSGLFKEPKIYIDGGFDYKKDGLVDIIQIGSPSRTVLNRNIDYNQFQKEFNEADEDLKNLKKEFKKYIKE